MIDLARLPAEATEAQAFHLMVHAELLRAPGRTALNR
jgi:hypothetical protein